MTLFNYSNMVGGLVIGTGDLSELALGWCTYGADHLSSYNPNVSIPKTLVIPIIRWVADRHMDKNTGDQVTPLHDVLLDIADTPISPELLPGQQLSEDTVGPYELMDFFLYYFLRAEWPIQKILGIAIKTFQDTYQADFVKDRMLVFLKRFQTQQFKRSCLPDGPKVGSCSLSPRGDWRMPSDMSLDVLIQEIKSYDTEKNYL
jgi:NAD+ synthase (glutamine-hydrolysing)